MVYQSRGRERTPPAIGIPIAGQVRICDHAAGAPVSLGRPGATTGYWVTGDGRLLTQSHYLVAGLEVLWVFGHNPAGQIASAWRSNDAYAWTGAYVANRPYTTNGLNQYSAAGGTTFAYDANGNLISETPPSPAPVRTYVYDIENRLVGAPNGVTLSYDPLGRLYSVSSPSTDTRFLYDGDALVGEYSAAGTLLKRYVHDIGADVPAIQYEGATVSAATRRYLLSGPQGSIVAATDGNSVIQSRNAYDEYGIPASTNTGRFQYTGQVWLAELGMYYYKARIYSPTLGRFMQTDSVGYQDQFNLYTYVGNDPVNRTDPTGQETKTNCENVHAACTITALTGATFGARDNVAANMRDAQLALAPINRDLAASTGNEWGNLFEVNANGSVTPSVSVSDNSPTSVTNGLREILDLTDTPGGDQHAHPGLPPGMSYEGGALSRPDTDTADAIASREDRPFNRTVIDGPTGNIISFIGRPGSMAQLPDGRWQRLPSAPMTGTAHIIGRVPAIP